MAVKYDNSGIERTLRDVDAQQVVAEAKVKLRKDLQEGRISLDRAQSLVDSMKAIEMMSPKDNIPRVNLAPLRAAKAEQERLIIKQRKEQEKAAQQAAKKQAAAPTTGGGGFTGDPNNLLGLDKKKPTKPTEPPKKDEPEEKKGFWNKLKEAFTPAKPMSNGSESYREGIKTAPAPNIREGNKQADWMQSQQAKQAQMNPVQQAQVKRLAQASEHLNDMMRGYQHRLPALGQKNATYTSAEREAVKREVKQLTDTLLRSGLDNDELQDMLRYQTMLANQQKAAEEAKAQAQKAKEHGVVESVQSVPENVFGSMASVGDIMAQRVERDFAGSDAPIDLNTYNQQWSNRANTTRGAVAENIADSVGGKTGEALSGLYQLGMSGADSLAALPFGPAGVKASMGASAARSAFQDAREKGGNDAQALLYGLGVGGAEGAIGSLPILNLPGLFKGEAGKTFVNGLIKQAMSEGAEEGVTEIADKALERAILTNKSGLSAVYNDAYNNAINAGYGEKDAALMARAAQAKSLFGDVGRSAAGGALLGTAMGGGAQLAGKGVRAVGALPGLVSDSTKIQGLAVPGLDANVATQAPETAPVEAPIEVNETAPLQAESAPVAPVEAPTASVDPAVEEAANIVAAEQAPVDAPKIDPRKGVTGGKGVTYTASNQPLDFTYAVFDADSVIPSNDVAGNVNAAYPAELQPRDRTRNASKSQIAKMSATLNPALLAESPTAQNGAPIVREDGAVIGGNGRTLAIMQAYEAGGGQQYADYVRQRAAEFGIDPNTISEKPILVRVANGVTDYAQLAKDLNASTTAAYSATESGASDAARMDGDILSLLVPDEDGKINTKENQAFIARFMNQVVPESERGGMMDSNGRLSQSGLHRVENAIFAKAYGDTRLLEKLTESLDNNSKNVTNALLATAPRAAALRNDIQSGNAYDVDVVADILNAVELYTDAKANNLTAEDMASQIRMDNKAYDGGEVILARFFSDHKQSGKQMKSLLNNLYTEIESYGSPDQVSLFGEADTPTKQKIYEGALKNYERETGIDPGQPDFDRFPVLESESVAGAGEERSEPLPVLTGGNQSNGENAGRGGVTLPGLESRTMADAEGPAPGVMPSVGAADVGFGGEVKKSRLASNTLKRTGLIDDKARSDLDIDAKDSYVYQVARNDESVKAAADQLNSDFEGTVDSLNNKSTEWTAQDADASMIAMSMLLDKGDVKGARRLINNLQGHSTEAGQAIQALKKYTDTGEYAVMKAYKILDDSAKAWQKTHERSARAINGIAKKISAEAKNGVTGAELEAKLKEHIKKSALKESEKAQLSTGAAEIAKNLDSEADAQNAMFSFISNGFVDLDQQTISKVMDLYAKAQNAERSIDRSRYHSEAFDILASKMGKTSSADKLSMIRYWAMLSSPRTIVKNELGNIAMGTITQTKDVVKAALEDVYRQFDKDYNKTSAALNYASKSDNAMLKATFEDADNVSFEDLMEGGSRFKPATRIQQQTEFFARANNESGVKGKAKRAVNKLIGTPGAILEQMDYSGATPTGKAAETLKKFGITPQRFANSPFAQAGLRNQYKFALARYLKANKLSADVFALDAKARANPEMNLTEAQKKQLDVLKKGRAYAIEEAKQATFHDQNALANLLNDVSRDSKKHTERGRQEYGQRVALEEVTHAAGLAADAMLPFRTTTSNIVARGLEYSPAGFAKAIVDGKLLNRGAERVIDDLAKSLTGTGLFSLGVLLAHAGWLNGSGADDRDKERSDSMRGKQNYSLNLPNGGTYDLTFTMPAGIPLFMGVQVAEDEMSGMNLFNTAVNSLTPLTENTILSAVNNTLKAAGQAETDTDVVANIASQAGMNYINQFVPTFAKQIGRAAQETRRSNYVPQTGGAGTVAYNMRKNTNWLPGLEGTEYIDSYGRNQKNIGDGFLGRLANNMLNPGYYQPDRTTPVDERLDSLFEESGVGAVYPKTPEKAYTVKKDGKEEKVPYTAEEYESYSKVKGQAHYELLDAVTGDSGFDSLPTDDKVSIVRDMDSLAKAIGEKAVVGKEPSNSYYELYEKHGPEGVASYVVTTAGIEKTGRTKSGEPKATNMDLYRAYFGTEEPLETQVDNYIRKRGSAGDKAAGVLSKYGPGVAQTWINYSDIYRYVGGDKDGSINQEEARAFLDAAQLTPQQKRDFWALTNSGWKKNPY